ncbi:hypothetical protein ACO0SA_003073 [Hanseniaspora valbyensis]
MGFLWNDNNKDLNAKSKGITKDESSPPATVELPKESKTSYLKTNLKHILKMSASGESADGCPILNPNKGKEVVDEPELVHNDSTIINSTNNMPDLRNAKQSWQKLDLPKEREISTIPKNDGSLWEYPSPQQMYNAMVRKGKIDSITGQEIPEEDVESMVDVHNFLNELCWQEIVHWESITQNLKDSDLKLVKFTGRPNDLTPRARFYHELSKIFPNTIAGNLPFDRHDWFVKRNNGQMIRYVIDFYEQPDDEITGEPVFSCDIRPGLDNFSNCKDRFVRYWFSKE